MNILTKLREWKCKIIGHKFDLSDVCNSIINEMVKKDSRYDLEENGEFTCICCGEKFKTIDFDNVNIFTI